MSKEKSFSPLRIFGPTDTKREARNLASEFFNSEYWARRLEQHLAEMAAGEIDPLQCIHAIQGDMEAIEAELADRAPDSMDEAKKAREELFAILSRGA